MLPCLLWIRGCTQFYYMDSRINIWIIWRFILYFNLLIPCCVVTSDALEFWCRCGATWVGRTQHGTIPFLCVSYVPHSGPRNNPPLFTERTFDPMIPMVVVSEGSQSVKKGPKLVSQSKLYIHWNIWLAMVPKVFIKSGVQTFAVIFRKAENRYTESNWCVWIILEENGQSLQVYPWVWPKPLIESSIRRVSTYQNDARNISIFHLIDGPVHEPPLNLRTICKKQRTVVLIQQRSGKNKGIRIPPNNNTRTVWI